MHEFYIRIPRFVRIPFTNIEIGEYLIPNAIFHHIKVTENYAEKAIFALLFGELAQLARALAWHARGHRFDPVSLHSFKSPSGDFCVIINIIAVI